MSTVAEILAGAADRLARAGVDSARLDAEVLLGDALGLSRAGLLARLREPCEVDAEARFAALLERRLQREPLAYIAGGREFWSLWFEVTPDTLIPRPETEGLVEIALASIAGVRAPRVLDIGTGSGCIAVAIASERADAVVTAIDVSPAALAVAERNAERLLGRDRIDFRCADLRQFSPTDRFDLVVANPPYVKRADLDGLQAEVARFEPRGALDGGDAGLDLVAALLSRTGDLLVPAGTIAIEIGADQGEAAAALARAAGLDRYDVRQDPAGLPRILVASTRASFQAPASPQPRVPSPPCP